MSHAGVWVLLILGLNSELLNLEWGPMSRQDDTLLVPLLYGMFTNAVLFYANAYWLVPTYLHSGRSRTYWLIVAAGLVGLTLLELGLDSMHLLQKYVALAGTDLPADRLQAVRYEFLLMFGVLNLFMNTLFWAAAFLYRMPVDWLRNERQKRQLIQDKLTAELDFLKAQINPHFLFNGINSIYHLMSEDVGRAQKILLEFSGLLRYQLYECRADSIPLGKELRYISSYLGIERMRKGEDAIITIDIPEAGSRESMGHLSIAPLLFTPFLENAFKYLSHHSDRERNRLDVRLTVEDEGVCLFVRNTVDPSGGMRRDRDAKESGIGLVNVERRLRLLYPDRHQLSVRRSHDCFEVNLRIILI